MKAFWMVASFLSFAAIAFSQLPADIHDFRKELYGTWFLSYGYPDSTGRLVFSRKSQGPERFSWGDRIEIYPNGDFVDAYSAKCGNDGRIHSSKGTWTLDGATMVFTATVPVALQAKAYKITHLSSEKLVFERLNN